MARKIYIGGSFAPPLSDEALDRIESEIIPTITHPGVKDGMERLAKMLRTFRETPDSAAAGRPHPSGVGTIIHLEDEEVKRIWDHVPWLNQDQRFRHGKVGDDDCDQYGALFDTLPTGPARDAAFHLLWYARELANDREPITTSRL